MGGGARRGQGDHLRGVACGHRAAHRVAAARIVTAPEHGGGVVEAGLVEAVAIEEREQFGIEGHRGPMVLSRGCDDGPG